MLRDAFNLADADVRDALGEALEQLRLRFSVDELSLHDLDEGGADLNLLRETFSVIQWSEIESSLGSPRPSQRSVPRPPPTSS